VQGCSGTDKVLQALSASLIDTKKRAKKKECCILEEHRRVRSKIPHLLRFAVAWNARIVSA
jgi:hypothetical protein